MEQESASTPGNARGETPLRLGKFSVSLTVKDLAKSRAFYEKLGFAVVGGEQTQNWLILQNDTATIGLFQGMFSRNMLTFVPGWDRDDKPLPDFDDVRDIQKTLEERGLALTLKADESSTGPASLMLVDPDGNPILLDQYVPRPTTGK
ncbi:MAG: VOC family protein [Planctomycetes bacterium]|nr:VOC family protein [Planctomycetota bacterium]